MSKKVIISCRIPAHLKRDLEEEAYEAHQSTSAYLESLLEQRVHLNSNADEIIDDLKQQVEELTEENNNLQELIEVYEADNSKEELLSEFEEVRENNESLQHQISTLEQNKLEIENRQANYPTLLTENFDSYDKEELIGYLEELSEKYPMLSEKQILLGAMNTAIKNESARWFIYTLKSYID